MKKIINLIEIIEKYFAITMMFGIIVATFLQVFSRYILGTAFMWTEELARLFCIWMVMISIGVLLKNDDHVGMNLLPEKFQTFRRIVTDLAALLFSILLISPSVSHFNVASTRFASGTNLPLGVFYIVMLIGIINLGLWSLFALILEISDIVASHKRETAI